MKLKHTPGPWTAGPSGDEVFNLAPEITVPVEGGEPDEVTYVAQLYDKGDETEGNAMVIAAAPDLALALYALLTAVRTNNEYGEPKTADEIFAEAGHQALAALAKLEGRTT